jgi:hypothetical protein
MDHEKHTTGDLEILHIGDAQGTMLWAAGKKAAFVWFLVNPSTGHRIVIHGMPYGSEYTEEEWRQLCTEQMTGRHKHCDLCDLCDLVELSAEKTQ